MTRNVPAAILTALSQDAVEPFFAVEFLFDGGDVRLWTGLQDRTIDGETYTGAGNLLGVGGLEEVADLGAKSATITLTGVPATIVALALGEPYQGRACRVLFGVVGETDFVEIFGGRVNTMSLTDAGDGSRVEVVVDSRLIELERSRVRRYTHESQQVRFTGDTFFSYVADLQDREVIWGRAGS